MRRTGSCEIYSEVFCWKYPYSEKVKVIMWTGDFKSETEEVTTLNKVIPMYYIYMRSSCSAVDLKENIFGRSIHTRLCTNLNNKKY